MAENRNVGFIVLSNLSRILSATLRQSSATIEGLSTKLADPWDRTLGG